MSVTPGVLEFAGLNLLPFSANAMNYQICIKHLPYASHRAWHNGKLKDEELIGQGSFVYRTQVKVINSKDGETKHF